nr:immunoglobulin heavy chain junction region [Macaca mulatta]MOY26904.1 immunoglobulin heavy chain junction region [Macaca mulatta]
CARRDENFDHW